MLGKYPVKDVIGGVAINNISIVHNMGRLKSGDIALHMISFGDDSRRISDGSATIVLMKARKIYYILPFFSLFRLAWEVRKIKPDLIHVHGSNLSPYLIYTYFLAGGVKKAVSIYGYAIGEKLATKKIGHGSPGYRLLKFVEKRMIEGSDLLICNTDNLKNDMMCEYGKELGHRIAVIPTGVDLSKYTPEVKEDARRALGMGEEDFVIFHAKAFIIYNGHEYLIRAMPGIKERVPNVKLYLAGDGPKRPVLETLIEQLDLRDNVVLLGNIPNADVKRYLGAADVVCIPSVRIEGVQENSSIFLVEAMAMRKPVIASRVGGLAYSVRDRDTGILVPDKDPEAIAAAVIGLYGDPKLSEKLGENARAYVEKERTWDIVVDQLVRSYKRLLR